MLIEIFKADKYKFNDEEIEYTESDLDSIIQEYSTLPENQKAPLVKGHPKDDQPAYGWVESLKRNGKILMAEVKDLKEDMIEAIRNKQYRNVSVALNGNKLRHVGILGAILPRVGGLQPVQLSDGENVNLFTYDETENQIRELKDKIFSLEKRNQEIEIIATIDKAIKEGKMLPMEKSMLLKLYSELGENENAKQVVYNLIPSISKPHNILKKLEMSEETTLKDKTDRQEIDKVARNFMKNNEVTYEQAVNFILHTDKG